MHISPLKPLLRNNSGVAIIEFALILPVLLLILLGVVEFGVYFMKEQIVQRTVSTTASAIQQDPNNEMNKDNAYGSGAGLVDYTVIGNYICAKSYATAADAKAGLCEASDWVTTAPTAGTPYFVAMAAYVQESSFTELFKNYIPAIKVSSVFKVGGDTNASGSVGGGCIASVISYNPTQFGSTSRPAGWQAWGNVTLNTSSYSYNPARDTACTCPPGYTLHATQMLYVNTGQSNAGSLPSAYQCIKD